MTREPSKRLLANFCIDTTQVKGILFSIRIAVSLAVDVLLRVIFPLNCLLIMKMRVRMYCTGDATTRRSRQRTAIDDYIAPDSLPKILCIRMLVPAVFIFRKFA
jgi:hypothetical protein